MSFNVIQDHRGEYQSKALCDFLLVITVIVTDILSHTVSELSQLTVQILDTAFFSSPPLGGVGTTLIGKHISY